MLEPQLEHVEDDIVLTVAEAMSIDPPSPVFVTVGTLIYYSLRVVHQNTFKVVELPSPHHYWSVLNSSVAQVDSIMGTVHALRLGLTDVVVKDTRLSGHIQTSALHVVLPEKMLLYLVPITSCFDPIEGVGPIPSSDTWYVLPGQLYIIGMKVFSEWPDSREILVTEENKIKLEGNTFEFWDILSMPNAEATKHGWQNSRLFKPYSVGEGILTASLLYRCENKEEVQVLNVFQKVTVCRKVKLNIRDQDESLTIIRIPWSPGVYQEVQLMATGGCGNLFWFSSNEATASVSDSGFVLAKKLGTTTIKVISLFDPINYDEVILEVSQPSSMVLLPIYPVEVAVGTELKAAITLKTSDGNYFYRCDAFNSFIRWNVNSETETFSAWNKTEKVDVNTLLTESSKQSFGQPCAWTCLFAYGPGRAVLSATLSTELYSHAHSMVEPSILKTAFSIAAYSPLVSYQVGNGNKFGGYWIDMPEIINGTIHSHFSPLDELHLSPGSSIDILLCGGPERWDRHVEYVEKVEVYSEHVLSVTDGVQVVETYSTGRRFYAVVCLTLGKFKLLFSRGNLIGENHSVPTIANLELFVSCSFPSSIALLANELANTLHVIETATNADRGPGKIRSSPITVAHGCTIRIAAVGLHITKKPFTNSSSLCLSWELVGCKDLAYWSDNKDCRTSTGNNWERFLVLNKTSGLCTVRASIIGFSETMASHNLEEYFQIESSKDNLTDALQLQLVFSLRIRPEFALVVFNPEAKVNLSISGGTCFLKSVANDTRVAEITQYSENLKCSHLIVSPKGLGTALITVRDIGLTPPVDALSMVKVANVEWIKFTSEEEICLMEGTTSTFELLAGTNDGYIFEFTQYKFMNIRFHLENEILELIDKNNSWSIIVGPKFSVRATIVGITTIYVSVRQQPGLEILSQSIKIEVYKPLQVHPGYIFLTPGASYVLTSKGGPGIGGFIEYKSMHEGTVVVQAYSGKVSAISIGNTTIRGAVFGKSGDLICEAYSTIEVGIPSYMNLSSQSDQLCIGCKMPIFPSFPKGSLFSFYEVCNSYEWKVDNEKMLQTGDARTIAGDVENLQLYCVDGLSTFCYPSDGDVGFIKTMIGCFSGRAKVSVSFSCEFPLLGTTKYVHYMASKTLIVVPDPPLALGMQATWVLPPFYSTSELLPSITDSYGLDVHSHMKGVTYSVLRLCDSKQDSITIHGRKIRTSDINDLACILEKDQNTQRTEIASCVRVAQVAQVRLSAPEYSFHSAFLGVNSKMELLISYCDELGLTFAEANDVVPLDFDINYPDVLSIQIPDNRSIASAREVFLEAKDPGRALARISMRHNQNKADFILVSVGAQLYPQNPVLNVGQSIKFSVTGIDGLAAGHWFCINGSVLSVNRNTGETHASAEGGTLVIFQGSNFKLQTMVTVIKASWIIVDTTFDTFTNAPFPTNGYKFRVKLSGLSGYKYKHSDNHAEIPYECRVDPPFLGYAKPWSDDITGESSCLFFPYTPKNLQNAFSKSMALYSTESNHSKGFMHFSIVASLKEAPHITGFAHALFVGGFSIEIERLYLTMSSNRSRIGVTGNTDVEIYWNLKDLLLVTLFSKEGSGIGGFADYEVEVLRAQSFRDKLIFVLPATGQKAEVEVIYENGTNSPPAPANSMIWTAIIVCIVLLISTIFIFVKLLEGSGRPIPSVPTTPASARTGSSQVLQRTPQPLMDHVRRTIDETPYYKTRNNRRLFDPQHSY